jgi:carbonic anhydrase
MKKINFIILSVSISLSLVACAQKQIVHHWEYEGEYGSVHWGALKPEYLLCGDGMAQSPINISKSYKTDLDSIGFSYKDTPLKIVNNGHTIKAKYKPGSAVTMDGEKYELLQFHFHSPSEHEIEGKSYDMEMHLVHKNESDELAVVGVFIKRGKHNNTIQTLWHNLPEEINKENIIDTINVNAADLLPDDKSYYRYYGSLTTPPCSEGVSWNVLKSPIEMSDAQIKKFESIIGYNSRLLQPVNKRFVLESQ